MLSRKTSGDYSTLLAVPDKKGEEEASFIATKPPTSPEKSAINGAIKPEEEDRSIKASQPPESQLVLDRPSMPIGTILARTIDTIEDLITMARRVPYDKGWLLSTPRDESLRETIVVLGSGWAAHALMKVADTYKVRLIVVSPVNHFVFTPMLASAAVGTVEYRSMTEAVRQANPMINDYLEGRAIDVDVNKQIVKVQLNEFLEDIRGGNAPLVEIPYDRLVVAVGCKVNDSIVPGAAEHCLRLKTVNDARRLRTAVGESLEYASRPDVDDTKNLAESEAELRRKERRKRVTFCIVGGGPTGVELAGELADFLKDITRERVGAFPKLKNDARVVLVQGGPELVPQFDPDLRRHALYSLEKEGVEVRLETVVQEVGENYIKLSPKDGDEVETLPVGLTVWAAGTGPVEFTETLLNKLPPEARARGNRVTVDQWLRCPMTKAEKFGTILVLGDAASFQDRSSFLPQTAQVAGQQGAYAARLLCRDYDLTSTPPLLKKASTMNIMWNQFRGLDTAPGFDFVNLGILAYVGGGQALSQIQLGDVPIASYAGSISFVLWRSVYLVKQVATRNRVLVTFDWFKSAIFGRDVTRL